MNDPKNARYDADPRGLLTARRAVCGYYEKKGFRVSPEQVLLTSSTSEGYHYLFRLLANPGEAISAAEPSYPLIATLSELNDVTLHHYRLAYDDDAWRIDFDSLKTSVDPHTRAILTVHPNNPTGNFVSREEKKQLNETCARQSCALIADEVFLDFNREENNHPESFVSNETVLTFTLSGLSKILGLPQMKLSWIVVSGPDAERTEALRRLEVISDAYLSVNTPAQHALPLWLHHERQVRDEIMSRVRANHGHLKKAVEDIRCGRVLKAEGGWAAIVKTSGSQNDEDMAIHLLDQWRVLVHPGFLFDFPSEGFLVMSLLSPEPLFVEGVRRLCGGLAG